MRLRKIFLIILLFAVFGIYMSNADIFSVKITTSNIPDIEVIPGGDTIGIKVFSKGILIIGESDVLTTSGESVKCFEPGDFKAGDILLKVNNTNVETLEEFVKIINKCKDSEVIITIQRDNKILFKKAYPAKCLEDGKYKIGLWVRDGAMGVGTLTFYNPDDKSFAALGHGISDEDSKELIQLEKGEIYEANIVSISKGRRNSPGEIKGFLRESEKLGDVGLNSSEGIYGKMDENVLNMNDRKKIKVAGKNEVKIGKASIFSTVDGSGVAKEYDIEIQRIFPVSLQSSRGMVIKVTDEELIEKTGGIVQGMSGSPIIQNGKLVGAVTHVYVNDPTKGYGIFAENMINQID